jgi:DNA-binding HxlR family transcriptional regulator
MSGYCEPTDHCEPFVADCQLRLATDLVAHTWDPVVLSALRAGPRRRRDLLTGIGGISDKALTQAITRLSASGLIERTVDTTRAATYQLSELGASLAHGPLAALARWAAEHGSTVQAAQERAASPTS